jgi:DNA-binding beta-propeller fold protein YncE
MDAGAASVVTTLAGAAGAPGHADGPGTAARFHGPMAVAVSPDGTFALVADAGNAAVRRIALAGPISYVVTTLSGALNTPGYADGVGAAARFLYPSGLGMSPDGRFAMVTDRNASTLRKMDTATGNVVTIAGLAGTSGAADGVGTVARFYLPGGVAVSPDGWAVLVTDEVGSVSARI